MRGLLVILTALLTISCGPEKGDIHLDKITGEKVKVLTTGKASNLIELHNEALDTMMAIQNISRRELSEQIRCAKKIFTGQDSTVDAFTYQITIGGTCVTVISPMDQFNPSGTSGN